MTINNYTTIQNLDIIETIKGFNKSSHSLYWYIKKNHIKLLNEIFRRTKFLDESYKHVSFRARLYCIKHNIHEIPKCKNSKCNNIVKWRKNEFFQYCCTTCSNADLEVQQKKEHTCLKHFGVKNQNQSEEIKQKIRNTCLSKYGTENPTQSEQIKNKIKQTMKARYGVEYYLQSEKFRNDTRNKCKSKYGVEYPLQSKELLEKSKQTKLKKYGAEHYTQTEQFHKNRRRKFQSKRYPGLLFDSTWEVKVYEFCQDNNIPVEYSPSIRYEYYYMEQKHIYEPDFLINGKLYEVKGEHFFRRNKATGKEEMFCPYGRTKLSKERYDWLCGLFEAKHQCMIANNVYIIRKRDMKNLSGLFI